MADTPLSIAEAYTARGWRVVPMPFREKGPRLRNWQALRLTAAELPRYFDGQPMNVGVLLGEVSDHLVDVDLDDPVACHLAPHYLPLTGLVFGRAGKPRSHYLYRASGVKSRPYATGEVVAGKQPAVELRASGQTMFPGSVHPSGELVEWAAHTSAPEVPAATLTLAVRRLAAATIIARHWVDGQRDHLAFALAGLLTAAEWKAAQAQDFLSPITSYAHDHEWRDRLSKFDRAERRAEQGEPLAGRAALAAVIGDEDAKRVVQYLDLREPKPPREGRPTIADLLCDIALERTALWYDEATARPYASVTIGSTVQHLPLTSTAFRAWLAAEGRAALGKVPSGGALADALAVLQGTAQRAPHYATALRFARDGGTIYYDLADAEGRAVAVTADGWTVLDAPPEHIKFRRPGHLRAQVVPVSGGSLDALAPLINVESEDVPLVLGLVLAPFRCAGPFPIGLFTGERGSAKSTLLDVVRRLTDPAIAGRGTPPKNEDDLILAAGHNAVLSFDNLSRLGRDLGDALCRLATGGGLMKRRLYTDDELVALDAKRPVLLTGINIPTNQEDLLDRVVHVPMARLRGERPVQREDAYWTAFESAAPALLGALLDAVSRALRDEHAVPCGSYRLADFVAWCEAAAIAPAGDFGAAYQRMQDRLAEDAAESQPVVEVLAAWVERAEAWSDAAPAPVSGYRSAVTLLGPAQPGTGTVYWGPLTPLYAQLEMLAREMYPHFERLAREGAWPRAAKDFARRMVECTSSLARRGVAFSRHDKRGVTFYRVVRERAALTVAEIAGGLGL